MGARLGSITRNLPKAIIEVNGKELIQYTIDMAHYINVSRILVVGGYGFKFLKSFLLSNAPEAIVTENPDYKKGNVYSLKCALPHADDGFLLFNVDHVFSKDLLDVIMRTCGASKEITLFCDNIKPVEDDQMKVSIKENRLQKISKGMEIFDTGYIGLVYCPKAMLGSFIKATDEVLQISGVGAVTEDIINYLANNDNFIRIANVSGYEWFEVDTREDLHKAEVLVSGSPNKWIQY